MSAEAIAATEGWFRRRGIPHFIEEHGAHRSVLTRALPFLIFMLVVEILFVFNVAWAWWINVLVVAGACGAMAATWAGVNALRRRPLLALPQQMGGVELLVFLIAPSAISAALLQDWALAPIMAVLNALILAVAYVTVSFGLLPILGWAGWLLVRNARDVAGLFARALPLLLLFVTFLFITEEVWRLAGGLEGPLLGLLIGLFVVVTGAFLVSRLPGEIGELETFDSAQRVEELVRGTPAEGLPVAAGALRLDVALSRRQRFNAGLVVLFSLALQVAFVSLVLGAFFVVFGMIAMDETLVRDWLGREPQVLLGIHATTEAVLTLEHVKVAAFLTAFSAFYFTVSIVTSPDYRAEFFEDIVRDLRQALAVRTVYLAAIEQEREAASAPAGGGGGG